MLCVNDIFSKYAWVFPLKNKEGVSIVDNFQKTLDKSRCKPNKIWIDKGSEIYNNSFKKWLKDNDIEMYLIPNEGKSIVAERFIRTLKTKIYKYMTSTSKNVYINKLDDIVGDKCWIFIIKLFFKTNICIIFNINRFHLNFSMIYRKTKMKPVDVKNNYIYWF